MNISTSANIHAKADSLDRLKDSVNIKALEYSDLFSFLFKKNEKRIFFVHKQYIDEREDSIHSLQISFMYVYMKL